MLIAIIPRAMPWARSFLGFQPASTDTKVPRSCSISWHPFSPWHNLSKLSSAHGLTKELLLVVKVVLVVFPSQQAASKQHDTTFVSLHLRIKNYTVMNKNNKNINSNQNHGDHCQHVQIGGQAYYDDRKYFLFSPDAPVPQAVESFRKAGVGQQMSDGTFDFVPQPRTKSRSVLIRKLAHGRISKTQDDAVQLTLKFFRTENVMIAQAIMDEAQDAIDALLNDQLTK